MIKDPLLHELELAFFGAITASVSHELNNILSIINEYSGLLNDLIIAESKGNPIEKERIQKIALNIADQIKRQRDIIKLLNRFAHRVDVPIAQFNLNELVNDIIKLSQRFASLRRISLEASIPDVSINITNSPFGIQHAIFACLKLAIDFSNPDESITTQLEKEDSQAKINIKCQPIDNNEQTEQKLGAISLITKNIGVKMTTALINDKSQCILLSIPLSIPDEVRDN